METLLIFLGMGVVTFFTRYTMIALLGRETAAGPALSEIEGPVLSTSFQDADEGPALSMSWKDPDEGPALRGSPEDAAGGAGLLQRWLRYVPPAVLAALIVPPVLAPEGHLEIGLSTWAVLAGLVVAWRTRNVLWTIAGGMAMFWILRALVQ